jgi:hypothetical protein
MNVQTLINNLAAEKTAEGLYNQYAEVAEMDLDHRGAINRQARLEAHLDCSPKLILLGEAAGYQGCRFSGVTFTSERLIMQGVIPRITAQPITQRRLSFSEPSATIVWGTLFNLQVADRVVMWNALPFHPHRLGDPLSNRTPTDHEIEKHGLPFLEALMSCFPGVPIVAVGKKAEGLLSRLGKTPMACVRHPANGGATKFRTQLGEALGTNHA